MINSRFVYHSASNWDATSQLIVWLSPSPLSLFYYQLGLSLADVIVAQTRQIAKQFEKMFKGFKRVAIVPQVYDAIAVSAPREKEPFVLWMARMVWYKHPEIFVELARSLSHIRFVMGGNGPLFPAIKSRAKGLDNLTLLGSINHDLAQELCGKAQLFVNTSMIEGFPNTLLESAARETPYVTLKYDPDEVICVHKIGLHSESFVDLVNGVSRLMNDSSLRTQLGRNARKYVLENHTPALAANAYCRIFESLKTKR
jgi:glycosyltransferase involved in cell wall biosynthesis